MTATILLVDDDLVIRTLLTEYLESLSYTVHAFPGGKEALAQAEGLTVDLVICDLQMPGMDGVILLGKLQVIEKFQKLPAIMLSANKETQELIEGEGINVSEVIAKPFDVHVVRDTIQKLLG